MWKEAAVVKFEVLFWYLREIIEEDQERPSAEKVSPSLDSNQLPQE
jgi:hypothetical protein